jgi:Mycothiol maleylpyruvate isomerase N-terminal domain
MQAEKIETAYLPFADTLCEGGFNDPDHGWGAAQIGAHIAMSNELFSELADRVRAGEVPDFDNSPTQSEAELAAYAAKFDSLPGLADAVLSSGARAAAAYAAMSADQRAVKLPTLIWHEGQVARDEPSAIGDLLAGNADFHLDMHLAQLRALRPE